METLTPAVDVVNNHPYLSLTSIVLGCAALVRLARWHSRPHLPPGPKGYPIVGNLLDIPPTHVWEKFGAWGKQYGGFRTPHNPHLGANAYSPDFLHTQETSHTLTSWVRK